MGEIILNIVGCIVIALSAFAVLTEIWRNWFEDDFDETKWDGRP